MNDLTHDDMDELAWLARVLEVVRERKGLDFSSYRTATMLRRVHNRMIAANVRTLPGYFERLRSQPGEADALVERLTIKVSRFFRDATTFAALRGALAERRAERAGHPLEIWSAGCGQGEEPYSVAIVLAEQRALPPAGSILATDIDRTALMFAEAGCYPLCALDSLPGASRARWFDERRPGRDGDVQYAIKPFLRRGVELQWHDLVGSGSPPGGRRFDLVCCRNVLIYLQHSLQERVQCLLARSLLPGGLLCLGEAEWLLPLPAESFEVLDRKARLFRYRGDAREGAS